MLVPDIVKDCITEHNNKYTSTCLKKQTAVYYIAHQNTDLLWFFGD